MTDPIGREKIERWLKTERQALTNLDAEIERMQTRREQQLRVVESIKQRLSSAKEIA